MDEEAVEIFRVDKNVNTVYQISGNNFQLLELCILVRTIGSEDHIGVNKGSILSKRGLQIYTLR